MTFTESQLGPEVSPEEASDQGLHTNAEARDRKLDELVQAEGAELPEVDQAPDPEAPAELTAQDEADLQKLQASEQVPAELDDRQQKIAIARETAQQASAAMDGLAPGSKEEKQNLQAMRDARRENSMTVEGLQASDTVEPTPTQEAPEEKKKWNWRHPFGGGEK